MTSKQSVSVLFFIFYCMLFFITTTTFYYVSISSGGNGLGIPLFGGGDDGVFYYAEALNIASGLPAVLTSIHAFILGWILKIFQTDEVFVLRAFNFIGSYLLLVISLRILKQTIYEKKGIYWISAAILILFIMFYPSLLLNTTLSIYRDVWIYVFFLWSIHLFISIFINKSKFPMLVNLLLFIFIVFMLGEYRKYSLLSFLVGSFAYLIIQFISKKNISLKKYFLFVFIGFSIFYVFFRSYVFPYVNLSFDAVLLYRQSALETGGSQMGISLDQSNVILFYLYYMYSFVSNVIGPFPWQITGISTLILMLTEGTIFLFILAFLYRKRKYFVNIDKYLIIQSVIWFALISISNDNFGTGSRLRIVGWLPLIILFAKYYGEYLFIKRQHIKNAKILKMQNYQ